MACEVGKLGRYVGFVKLIIVYTNENSTGGATWGLTDFSGMVHVPPCIPLATPVEDSDASL